MARTSSSSHGSSGASHEASMGRHLRLMCLLQVWNEMGYKIVSMQTDEISMGTK
jgi:hypothetical protein